MSKHIPAGKTMYTGASIYLSNDSLKVDGNEEELKHELESFLRPIPNKSIAGVKLGVLLHYRAEKRKIYFISKFLNRKIGEQPVYMDKVKPAKTIKILNNRLENRGFYNSQITYKTEQKGKFASVVYDIQLTKPYRLNQVLLESDSSEVYRDIKETQYKSFLKNGDRFDLDKFKEERERIDTELKKKGYYSFNSQYLIFEVDTNQAQDKEFIAYLRLKRNLPKEAIKKYTLDTVLVHSNYGIDSDSATHSVDTLNGISFVRKNDFFKPKRLRPFIFLEKDAFYNPENSRITSDRLSSIGTYKYVNINYSIVDTVLKDSTRGLLKTEILLSPLPKYSLSAQLQALSKSNNFIGPALNFYFSDRNVFGGGEVWNASLYGGYELQLLIDNNQNRLSSTQIGASTDLVFPRFLSPFTFFEYNKYAVPKTKIKVGYERLLRGGLFQLNTFNIRFGYLWKETKTKYHELFPFNANFVRLSNTSSEFNKVLDENLFLKNSFRQEFIAGIIYSFTYNELSNAKKKTPLFLSTSADLAGNTLGLLNRSTGRAGNEQVFGLRYAQYAKVDVDVRQYFRLKKKQVFIARFFGGIGVPYGNSDQLPFSKQFFSGGPFSVRSFRIHSLGPGTFRSTNDDAGAFFNQSGDVKLEANLEYRFPIVSILEGALFTDAGNVWLLNSNDDLPGGEFTRDFAKQLGAGAGVGIRANIQNFAIRLDLGIPVMQPFEANEQVSLDLNRSVLNFAIGYPF